MINKLKHKLSHLFGWNYVITIFIMDEAGNKLEAEQCITCGKISKMRSVEQ